ncbi:Pycsar system effector family protein [Sphaerisporangium perillae]|uniref:Pycsar system effector family protein n=1 Tax=Sphaerisporangium perillae TaxID=2935860 RepID=UPI00200DAB70|nr:Pycsar system effector family protein [Sphaerisporangium perillae]
MARSAGREEAEAVACAYAARLLADTREEVNRADAKAQVLLGVAGIGLGAVAGGIIAQSWSPFALSNSVEWLWWAGVAAALAALGCLSGAVYPRTGTSEAKDPRIIAYYGDVVRFGSVQALADAMIIASRPDLLRISDQVRRMSGIVHRKYRMIRWGFWLLCAAVLATVCSVVIDLVLSPP